MTQLRRGLGIHDLNVLAAERTAILDRLYDLLMGDKKRLDSY